MVLQNEIFFASLSQKTVPSFADTRSYVFNLIEIRKYFLNIRETLFLGRDEKDFRKLKKLFHDINRRNSLPNVFYFLQLNLFFKLLASEDFAFLNLKSKQYSSQQESKLFFVKKIITWKMRKIKLLKMTTNTKRCFNVHL